MSRLSVVSKILANAVMKSRRGWVLLSLLMLLMLVPPLSALAEIDLFAQPLAASNQNPRFHTIVSQLSQAQRIRSQFRQIKTMRVLRKPLISEGNMIFDQEQGLYWNTRIPFASTMLINDQRIVQRSGDQESVVSARQNPVAFGFAQVFFQVLSGDLENLTQQFELFFNDAEDGWQIGLVPRDEQLRALLANIVLRGDSDLNDIAIVDHAGDTTTIEFYQRQVNGPELNEQERAFYTD